MTKQITGSNRDTCEDTIYKTNSSNHGGDVYSAEDELGIDRSKLLDFSANIMPAEIDDRIKNSIIAALDNCRYYPDPQQRRLRQALAAHHKLQPDQIVCGNGAADLIYRTVHALKPVRAYLPVPSFSEYERALRETSCKINYWQLNPENGFQIENNMLNWLSEQEEADSAEGARDDHGASLLILCQPNNPTGLLIEPTILAKVIERCAELGIYLLIDECFLDFLKPAEAELYSSMDKLRLVTSCGSGPKLMLLRSMTKYYSLPGLRAGYLCTTAELAANILASGQPWPVGTLTEAAVLAIINRDQETQNNQARQVARWLAAEKPLLEQALRECGFDVWSGAANYIFFRAVKYPDLDINLRKQGIIIRSCTNYVGLDQTYFRIAVLSPGENFQFILALKEICALSY